MKASKQEARQTVARAFSEVCDWMTLEAHCGLWVVYGPHHHLVVRVERTDERDRWNPADVGGGAVAALDRLAAVQPRVEQPLVPLILLTTTAGSDFLIPWAGARRLRQQGQGYDPTDLWAERGAVRLHIPKAVSLAGAMGRLTPGDVDRVCGFRFWDMPEAMEVLAPLCRAASERLPEWASGLRLRVRERLPGYLEQMLDEPEMPTAIAGHPARLLYLAHTIGLTAGDIPALSELERRINDARGGP